MYLVNNVLENQIRAVPLLIPIHVEKLFSKVSCNDQGFRLANLRGIFLELFVVFHSVISRSRNICIYVDF